MWMIESAMICMWFIAGCWLILNNLPWFNLIKVGQVLGFDPGWRQLVLSAFMLVPTTYSIIQWLNGATQSLVWP